MSRPLAQPLRPLTDAERQELQRVSRAPSETVIRHQRATALLAVADGMSLIEAARTVGWRVHDTVTRLLRRFNERGLSALDDLPRSGHPRTYDASAKPTGCATSYKQDSNNRKQVDSYIIKIGCCKRAQDLQHS